MEGDAKKELDDFDEWLDRYLTNIKLRQDHPYVGDLIKVLRGYRMGRPRIRVLEILESQRKEAGLPMPNAFEESVQSSFNRHSSDSKVFERNKKENELPLFFSPGGKGSGKWAVHEDNALKWLKSHLISL
ncbi:hypothetical protein [Acidocella facilis]|uniref:hypothetical protein n=1 Tax=Acidocella facilis TaxID=525 RepID=UPI001F21FAEB|nr:hypothetical protein [Acidocella facilis]